MKKLIYGLVGLALLASASVTQALDVYVKKNKEIIQVCNQESLGKNYKGDIFFHYRKENGKWVLDKLTYEGNGVVAREFVSYVTKEDIPTYVDGLRSLYYDKDQDEENLVAVFDISIDSKVKDAWIELAKEHVKELNGS